MNPLLLILLMFFLGCNAELQRFDPHRGNLPSGRDALDIQYNSVGCYKISYGGAAILSDPFWSHLSFGKVMFGKLESDSAQIEPYLPPLNDVSAVLVGHGHYDHVLDIPYISERMPVDVPILGSKSLGHQLLPCKLPQPFIPVNDLMASVDRAGEWIYLQDSLIRVLPIKSAHPPQFIIRFFRKTFAEDRPLPPIRSKDFQEGQPLAWLIDFMGPENQEIRFRVFLQTTSDGFPNGFFPRSRLKEKAVDVALVSLDVARYKVSGKHTIIDFLHPSAVVFGHWENFFKPKSEAPGRAERVRIPKLLEALEADNPEHIRYILPHWGAHFWFD